MNIINKIDSYLTEKPKPKKPNPEDLERYAKEVIRMYKNQKDEEGDIQNMVQAFADAYGIDAEDFFTAVTKIAKKMNVKI